MTSKLTILSIDPETAGEDVRRMQEALCLLEQLRQLLADPAAILAMAQHNADYYQMWLRPEQQVRQVLRQLETGEL